MPVFKGNEKKYINDCIDSTYVSSVGAFLDKFEAKMCSVCQVSGSVATVNGTSALQIALNVIGVNENDEVLTQALTFVATINSIIYNKAVPVFLDVDLDTMGLSNSVKSFEEYGELRADGCYNKKTGRKISACIAMHTFGFPVHLDEMIKVCNQWKTLS